MRTGVHQAFVSQILAASHTLPFVNLHLVCWFQSSYKAKISALETKCKRLDVIQTSKRSVSETKHDSKRLNSTGVVKNERGSNQIATRPKPSSFSLYLPLSPFTILPRLTHKTLGTGSISTIHIKILSSKWNSAFHKSFLTDRYEKYVLAIPPSEVKSEITKKEKKQFQNGNIIID